MKKIYLLLLMAILIYSCRKDDKVNQPTKTTVDTGASGPIKGFFLLNEGNMGSNQASIDYYDYPSGTFFRNIYPSRNPTVINELGDVGNDIQIYGSKLYAVINESNLVEVMDVKTARHIASISIPNCRYLAFDKGYAYVSSYAGPLQIDPNARPGFVARIDTVTLSIKDTCVVGYQPEEMVVRNNYLYVANSGSYRVPDYDNTVSVIDLNTFKQIKKITVGINLEHIKLDTHGNIYVTSRGDYGNIHSNLYVINTSDQVSKVFNLPASNLAISGDSAYVYSTEYNNVTKQNTITYAIINTASQAVISTRFITDGTDKKILVPFGIAVNPYTKEIFVTDAKGYVTPGRLYCFTPHGKYKWDVETGEIPGHFVFTTTRLSGL